MNGVESEARVERALKLADEREAEGAQWCARLGGEHMPSILAAEVRRLREVGMDHVDRMERIETAGNALLDAASECVEQIDQDDADGFAVTVAAREAMRAMRAALRGVRI